MSTPDNYYSSLIVVLQVRFSRRVLPPAHSVDTAADIARLLSQPVREFITAGDIQERIPAHSPLPQLLVNALEGAADPYGLGVVTGQQIEQYLWSQTRDMGISPREGKLPGGYFDRGEFLFRVGLSKSASGRPDGTPPPPSAFAANRTPMPSLSPSSPVSRSYLVFFDADKAVLTDRARAIFMEAASNSTKVQYSLIEVNGYTDTFRSPQYSQELSVRMAQTVAAELVKDGIPQTAISFQGFGSTHLLVPTGPGVREPQNRRVEILIKQLQQQVAADRQQISRLQGAIKYTVNSDLLFAPGSWKIRPQGEEVIANLAKKLAPTQQNHLIVSGYTDNAPIGPALQREGVTSNQDLSQKRADAVMQYLISQGVGPELVSAQGFGDASPVASNDTAQGREQNRRVELSLGAPAS